ncbi:MAG: hypothetical protein DDT31_01793 [Syntrophomonadaceae bacterium]|nr:hypothetical protein [Bacillota bacterium]
MLNCEISYRTDDLSGLCAPWTIGCAVAALMTKPNVRIAYKLILYAPLGIHHLFSREWFIIRSHIAHYGACGALIALF